MLSYRHAFHAGNFADVFKHVLLIQLIRALQCKDKPFRVFDTHAGAGRYDLHSAPARKNREYQNGIGQLWDQSALGPELREYREQVRVLNPDGALREYPGSPRLIRTLLRPEDRLTLIELHPGDYPALKAEFTGDRQVAVHHADGYASLKAFLPPPERRGLVFIDPAFELRNEFDRLVEAVQTMHWRWATGMAAIWYPILDRAPSLRFQRNLQQLGIPAILCAELGLYPYDQPVGLHGCGMIVINPPWKLDETLNRLLPELLAALRTGEPGQIRLEWLMPAN
ncbi:MAG TPA: 23S rRNA (adenine(2030)-N(6))-methyltransferase RlmJ [Candidatus Competibacteraceae bacterium]|nr:23S rRNA (adenine(2030)-N(6))-methyltransferase RlmJ [Candidatus Competibacteraceae bacterium]HRZ05699.1 23S rRNA (adenine(2030)-N(6))-methyltransferase RlmJ [Candidatus Competibacteraceae bacterium]HSA46698.1 23S rRNA (adenine(2030)-N(6))-methyltransferase RlmJ [Candidatus Competibacteraceae bacterium]